MKPIDAFIVGWSLAGAVAVVVLAILVVITLKDWWRRRP